MITTLASCSLSSRLLNPLYALDLSEKCDTNIFRQKGAAPASNGRPGTYTSSGRCSCPQTKRLRFSSTALAAARLILCYSFIHTGDTTPLRLTDFASAASLLCVCREAGGAPLPSDASSLWRRYVLWNSNTRHHPISLPERGKFTKHKLRTVPVKLRATGWFATCTCTATSH